VPRWGRARVPLSRVEASEPGRSARGCSSVPEVTAPTLGIHEPLRDDPRGASCLGKLRDTGQRHRRSAVRVVHADGRRSSAPHQYAPAVGLAGFVAASQALTLIPDTATAWSRKCPPKIRPHRIREHRSLPLATTTGHAVASPRWRVKSASAAGRSRSSTPPTALPYMTAGCWLAPAGQPWPMRAPLPDCHRWHRCSAGYRQRRAACTSRDRFRRGRSRRAGRAPHAEFREPTCETGAMPPVLGERVDAVSHVEASQYLGTGTVSRGESAQRVATDGAARSWRDWATRSNGRKASVPRWLPPARRHERRLGPKLTGCS